MCDSDTPVMEALVLVLFVHSKLIEYFYQKYSQQQNVTGFKIVLAVWYFSDVFMKPTTTVGILGVGSKVGSKLAVHLSLHY